MVTIVLRFVAHQFLRIAEVPEPAGVVGYPEEDGKGHLGPKGFYQELGEVTGTAPLPLNGARVPQQFAVVRLKPAKPDARCKT